MTKKINYLFGIVAMFFMAGCSETLEETYDEYTQGGMIRYLGKCSELQVNPGWERLQVVWKNNIDPGIDSVKITWQSENEEKPLVRYIDRMNVGKEEDLMDTIYLENLADAIYTVRVSNVAADGSESLVEENYGRPYTATHEDLRTFSRGISAFSRMGDKLALILDQDNENIEKMLLHYYDSDGQEQTWDIKAHMNKQLGFSGLRDYMFLLPEEGGSIDFSRPLMLERKGRLTGCVDDIEFQGDTLNLNERLWSSGFSQLMLGLYGEEWEQDPIKVANEVETLELDYNIGTMQDLIYLPNLKKVILGKNRYMQPEYAVTYASTTDAYLGMISLYFLYETRDNFVVERYNDHYFGNYNGSPFIDWCKGGGKISNDFNLVEKGAENLDQKPAYKALDTKGWEVTCSDTLLNGNVTNGAGMLLVDDLMEAGETYFEPNQTAGAAVITVTYDMQQEQVVKGFKVAQPSRNQTGDAAYLLSSLMIEWSTDGYRWNGATYTDGSATIGNSPAEETFIAVPEDLQTPVRYIRLTMATRSVGYVYDPNTYTFINLYTLRLGQFIPLAELEIPEE